MKPPAAPIHCCAQSDHNPSSGEGALGVALIGCGNFARHQHLPNLLGMQGVALRAVCDTSEAALKRSESLFGRLPCVRDAQEIWDDPEVHAVVIAVPDEVQGQLAEAALLAGKHVYLEKPGGTLPEQFAVLEAAGRQSGRLLAIGFNKRWAPVYLEAKRILARKAPPSMMVMRMADDAWRWLGDGGDLLGHDACHLFDLAAWFANSRVSRVYAVSPRPRDYRIQLGFASGRAASILIGGEVSMDFPKERAELFLDRGALVIEDFVELRTFGDPDLTTRLTFAGRAARMIDRPWVERMGDRGMEGMLEVRRALWEDATVRNHCIVPADERVLPNFLRDQGWHSCLQAFCAAAQGRSSDLRDLATVEDAAHAFAIASTARKSIASGCVEVVA
jgi:predicted dehydrogenase